MVPDPLYLNSIFSTQSQIPYHFPGIDIDRAVHGTQSLNMFSRHSANYRAGTGKMREGKGVGTRARTEGWATDPSE